MATRFHPLNEPAPYTPPTWEGGWDVTSVLAAGTRAFDPHKFGDPIPGTFQAVMSETVSTSPYRMGILRLVSRRLKRNKTIAGTVNMVLGVFQSNADADYFTRLHIYIIDTSDDSIVGTLLNQYEESSAGGATEWPTTAVGRALQAAQSLSSVLVPDDAGDYRLIAEIGVRAENTHTTARIAGVRYGARTSNYAPLSDLTVGASTSALAGFLEFSDDIELADDVVPNVTVETAIEIAPDADPVVQDMVDGGYTYEGWYKRTAQAGEQFLSVRGFGDLTTYQPLTQIYLAGGVAHVTATDESRRNKPVGFNTVPGTTYFFRFSPNSGNPDPASLTVEVQTPPSAAAPSGSLLILDDTFGYPAVLLDATTGAVLKIVSPFAASEAGAILPSGVSLFVDDDEVTTGVATVKLYDPALNLLASLPLDVRAQGPVTSNGVDKFFISNVYNAGLDNGSIHVVTANGVHLGKIAKVTGASSPRVLLGMAVSLDESILYYSRYHLMDGMEVGPIKQWDLVNDVALSDFAASISNYKICREILRLADGTILASYNHISDPDSFVIRYDTDGSVLNTYPLETEIRVSDEIRLAHDPDDPLSFWVWTKTGTDPGLSKFRRILVADGSDVITPIEVPFFSQGLPAGPVTEEMAFFGHSFSCPFVVMRSAAVGESGVPVIGPYVLVHTRWLDQPESPEEPAT